MFRSRDYRLIERKRDEEFRQYNEPYLSLFRASSYEPGWPGWLGFPRSRFTTFSFVKNFDVFIWEGRLAQLPKSRFYSSVQPVTRYRPSGFFPWMGEKTGRQFPSPDNHYCITCSIKTIKNAENLVVNYNCSWTNSWRCCVIVEQKLHIGITNKLHSGYFRMQNASSVFDNWSR